MPDPIDDIELDLLVQAIYRRYGQDFRHYARASLKRRLMDVQQTESLPSLSQPQDRVLHDPECADRLVRRVSVSFSEMFRDPPVFRWLASQLFPWLGTHPFVRIWHVGCAGGEEVYSLAILLHEAGLQPRCRIYATDMHAGLLKEAQEGLFPLSRMRDYTANYQAAGGRQAFSTYYSARYGRAVFRNDLKDNITFAQHNLATDGAFNVFNLILCRNVLFYFDETLTARVHGLLYDSLERGGVLVLGHREDLHGSPYAGRFEAMDGQRAIYRKLA